MKKLLALFLTVVLVLATVPAMGVSAISKATFSIGSATGAPGEEVTVAVSIGTNPGLTYAQISVGYFTEVLEVVSIEKLTFGGMVTTASPLNVNPLKVTYANCLEDTTQNGNLAIITFKIKDNAAPGNYTLTTKAEQENVYNVNLDDVPFTTINGIITVAEDVCDHVWECNGDEKYFAIAATCKNPATYYVSCGVCGEASTETFEVGKPLAHDYVDVVNAKYLATAATCANKATYYKSCSLCGEKGAETFEAGKLANHKYGAWITIKEPTDTEAGLREKVCSVCGDKVTEEITKSSTATFYVGSAMGAPGEIISIPVSIGTNPGLTFAQIKVGYNAAILEVVEIEKLTFAGTVTSIGPTTANPLMITFADGLKDTTENGDIAIIKFKIREDAVSGDYNLTVTSDQANVFNTEYEDVPFVTVNGTVKVCNHIWTQTVNNEYLATEATCTAKATYYISCSECGAMLDATFEAGEYAHKYSGWNITKEPTTSETGIKERVCLLCNYKATEELPSKLTFYTESVIGAPGEEVKVAVSIAANTGITFAQAMVGYDSNALEVVNIQKLQFAGKLTACSPTTANPIKITYDNCLEDVCDNGDLAIVTFKIKDNAANGVYTLKVSADQDNVFDTVYNDVPFNTVDGSIRVCNHDWVEVADDKYLATEATCTKAATYYLSCSACGIASENTFEYGEVVGHDYNEVVADEYLATVATCTAKATYFVSCSVCGEMGIDTFEAGEVDADNHVGTITVHAAVESTCTVAGNNEYATCDDCNVVISGSDEKLPLAPHTYDSDYDYTCNMCKFSRAPHAPTIAEQSGATVILNAVDGLEYSIDGINWQTSPEFANLAGNKTYTFVQRVKASDDAQQSEASDGLEIYIPLIILGDASGDGTVNGRDYSMILQYINGWNVSIKMSGADVNGDGKVNGRDYSMILQYINGWDVDLNIGEPIN